MDSNEKHPCNCDCDNCCNHCCNHCCDDPMNCTGNNSLSFGALIWGAIKLAIALPLIWWLFPRLPIVEDIIALFR